MKIVYCIASTCNSGGMERVLAIKANWLARHGHEVTIITTDQRSRNPFFELDPAIDCVDLGVDYEANNGRPFIDKLLRYPLKRWAHRRRLKRELKRRKPDITVSMGDNGASLIPGIREAGRTVLEIHFSRFKRLQYGRGGIWAIADRWRSRTDEATARRYDRFVVLTEEDRLNWSGTDNILTIPNPAPFPSEGFPEAGSRKVLAVGRVTHQKGFDRLVSAWSIVGPDHPDWHLEIVGSGEPGTEELRRQIDSLGIANSVTITPRCQDMPSKYREAAIVALTSRYEGLPMVLIEAQTCGVPAVAMECKCGPRDIITDGVDGFLTPPDDVDAFAERLSRLMSDDECRRRMALKALQSSRRFEADTMMQRWQQLFEEITR